MFARRTVGTVVTRARVLPHRFVDEVVRGAFQLRAHLLEDIPQVIPTLEMPERLLVLILCHVRQVLWVRR